MIRMLRKLFLFVIVMSPGDFPKEICDEFRIKVSYYPSLLCLSFIRKQWYLVVIDLLKTIVSNNSVLKVFAIYVK